MTSTAVPAPDTSRRTVLLPVLAVGLTLVLWSSAFVAIRHLQTVPPGAVALGRLAVGTPVLGIFLLRKRFRRRADGRQNRLTVPRGKDWLPIATMGVLWFGLYMVTLNAAEQRIDAGTASMLIQLSPIVIAVLAAVFLHERPCRYSGC
ncbi:MAG: DMT family transporter [Actinomycetota bacterium]|nr:DMT family transporter [Actinomycetota bacterium]